MSIFEIEGTAKKEVKCDIAKIVIKFKKVGSNSYDVAQKVLKECDLFLKAVKKNGIDTKDIHFCEDSVESGYRDDNKKTAERSIRIRVPFDMKTINMIQYLLQKGEYDYELDVDGDISNRNALRISLAKEALKNSRDEAEQLAEMLGIQVIGVESIRKDSWGDESERHDWGAAGKIGDIPPMISDNLGEKTITESVSLKVKWNLE